MRIIFVDGYDSLCSQVMLFIILKDIMVRLSVKLVVQKEHSINGKKKNFKNSDAHAHISLCNYCHLSTIKNGYVLFERNSEIEARTKE